MPGREDIFLQVNAAVTEGADRLRSCLQVSVLQFIRPVDQPDPPAAPARAGLQHHRITDPFRRFPGFLRRGHCFRPGDDRKPRIPDQLFQHRLIAEPFHALGIRSDKDQAVLPAKPGKMGVLGQETIAGMNRLCARQDRGTDDLVFVQVASGRLRSADAVALICQRHMQCVPVFFGIDSHRGDPHFLAGPDNADSNLPPVGNQYF